MHELVRAKSQFIIATHAPILLAYPEATIYLFSERGIERVEYEDTEHYSLTRDFLMDRERYLRRLLGECGSGKGLDVAANRRESE